MADHLQALAVEQHEQDIAALRGQVDAMGEYQTVGPVIIDGTGAGVITVDGWHDLGAAGIGMSGVNRYRLTPENELQVDIRGSITSRSADVTWPNALPTTPVNYVPASGSGGFLGPAAMNGSAPNGRVYLNGSNQVVMTGFSSTTAIGCTLKVPLD